MIPYNSSKPTPGFIPCGCVFSYEQEHLYSPGYEIKKLKTTQLSLGQKINNQVMIYSYNGILSSSNSMHEF